MGNNKKLNFRKKEEFCWKQVLIPAGMFLGVMGLAITEYQYLQRDNHVQLLSQINAEQSLLHSELIAKHAERMGAIRRMTDLLANGVAEDLWKVEAAGYINDYPEIISMRVIAKDKVKWVAGTPVLEPVSEKWSLQPGPFEYNGTAYMRVVTPIRANEWLVVEGQFGKMLARLIESGSHDGVVARASINDMVTMVGAGFGAVGETARSTVVYDNMPMPGLSLKMEMEPTQKRFAEHLSRVAGFPLVFGPIVGALLAGGFFLMIGSMRKNRALKSANEALEQAGQELESNNRHLRNLLTAIDQSNTSVLVLDTSSKVVFANERWSMRFNLQPQDVEGRLLEELVCEQSLEQERCFCEVLYQVAGSGCPWAGEIHYLNEDGDICWDHASVTPVYDVNGLTTHVLAVRYDITAQKNMQERLNVMAYYDALTGLNNRTYLEERSGHLLIQAARVERLLAVMFLDLDHFKKVNDSLGHEVGDLLLKEVATRLKATVREDDLVVRLGGDEFVIVLNDVRQRDDLQYVAKSIIDTLTQPFFLANRNVYIGTSIGISFYPDDGQDMMTLMKHADSAMYEAKSAGRGNFRYFQKEMNERAVRRLQLESDLRQALSRREFELYYQPQVRCATGEIVGVEALLRWRHPELGMVPPVEFIPILEDGHLIHEVGRWVLGEATRQMVAWEKLGYPPVLMSVNISGRQLQEDGFAAKTEEVLLQNGYDRNRHALELEITESVLMERKEEAREALLSLNERLGIMVAIDDFGTGYSSLSSLKSLPVDTLKIDRSFVSDIMHDAEDQAIAKAIVAMGKSLNLRVVSEGVETPEQMGYLLQLLCDSYQGFLFSKPVPANEVMELFNQTPVRKMGS